MLPIEFNIYLFIISWNGWPTYVYGWVLKFHFSVVFQKLKYICYKAFIRINFLLTTPTNRLSPGQFVIRKSAFLSSISDKFCSLLLYSLQSQFFFLRLSRKEFFTTSWSGFPWGSTRNFGVVGERRRFSTHISGTSMHHRCACRRGFIKIMVTFSSLSLFSALLMKQNRGNVKGYR